MHIGVDDVYGLIHSVNTTAANVHDIAVSDQLLHEDEKRVSGDAGYLGMEKREELQDRDVTWLINQRLGKRKNMSKVEQETEKIKSSIRALVEHSFARIKQQFGYA